MSDQSNFLKSVGLKGTRDAEGNIDLKVVETPLRSLNNLVLGCGGIPRGRVIELYGPPSCGKTTLALNFCKWYQDAQLVAAWDDREGTFPGINYTSGIGLDLKTLTMMDTGDGNDALYQFQLSAAYDIFDLYVIDSQAAIIAKESSVTGSTVELNMNKTLLTAKLLAQFFRELRSGYIIGPPGTFNEKRGYNKGDLIKADKQYLSDGALTNTLHKLSDKSVTLILINHERKKVAAGFGDKSYTSGGEATKFDASIRLRITPIKKSKEKINGLPAYKLVKIRADKNKVAPPFGEFVYMMHQNGTMTEYGKKMKYKGDDIDEVDPDIEDITGEDLE